MNKKENELFQKCTLTQLLSQTAWIKLDKTFLKEVVLGNIFILRDIQIYFCFKISGILRESQGRGHLSQQNVFKGQNILKCVTTFFCIVFFLFIIFKQFFWLISLICKIILYYMFYYFYCIQQCYMCIPVRSQGNENLRLAAIQRIVPNLRRLGRMQEDVSFHMKQAFTGHGCFQKRARPFCIHCGDR